MIRSIALAIGLISIGGAAAACSATYTVRAGDTLASIAEGGLGTAFAYTRVHAMNRAVIGPNAHRLPEGIEIALPCGPAATDWSVTPRPAQAAVLMGQTRVQVVDIRADDVAGDAYVPGSLRMPYPLWRGPESSPGEAPDLDRLNAIVGGAGLDVEAPILIAAGSGHVADRAKAARVYWILKSVGAPQIAILDGGVGGWVKAGLPVVGAPVTAAPQAVELDFAWRWRADGIDVFGVATGQVEGRLLNALPRIQRVVAVQAATPVPPVPPRGSSGPAGMKLPLTALADDLRIEAVPAAIVDTILDRRDGGLAAAIAFGPTAELGALAWFYASEVAGLPGTRLYPNAVDDTPLGGG